MIITNIAVCKKNKNRVNIYNEEGYAFSCYLDTVFEYGLRKALDLPEEKIDEILKTDEVKYATEISLKLLGIRIRTEKEIRRSLAQKEISAQSIDQTIETLYECELLNDEEFADVYAKELSEKYGMKKVAQKLADKGINWSTANKAAAKYKNTDSLKYYYERARDKYTGTPYETEQKIIRSLLNKGFVYDDIKRVINGSDEE